MNRTPINASKYGKLGFLIAGVIGFLYSFLAPHCDTWNAGMCYVSYVILGYTLFSAIGGFFVGAIIGGVIDYRYNKTNK